MSLPICEHCGSCRNGTLTEPKGQSICLDCAGEHIQSGIELNGVTLFVQRRLRFLLVRERMIFNLSHHKET